MTADPDLTIIDDLGVTAVAKAIDISREAVRQWRLRGTIPDHRWAELRRLVANDIGSNGQPGWPTLPTRLPMVVDQGSAGQSDGLIDLATIAGPDARSKVEAAIAERDARLAGQHASRLAAVAGGGSFYYAVRGYGVRLTALFALDFPVLTMAFAAVAQVSPIVAAGSAIALSLFLVLGAHLLGGALHAASKYVAAWCRHATTLLVLTAFLTAIVWVTLDLRMKGLDLEHLASTGSDSLVFRSPNDQDQALPPAFKQAIAHAAALVTIGSLLFGISWSYRHHGPAAVRVKAEAAYRRQLRRLAQTRVKMARVERRTGKVGVVAAIAGALLTSLSEPSDAATCDGTTVLALVDTTTAYDDIDWQIMMPAIERMARSLQSQQRLMIRTVRDAPDASRLLLDACVPAEPELTWSPAGAWTWLTTNALEMRGQRDAFFTDARDALLPQLQSLGETSRTALIGTIERLAADTDDLDAIWLFSDLLESSVVDAEDLLVGDSDALLRHTERVPALHDIDVHVAGQSNRAGRTIACGSRLEMPRSRKAGSSTASARVSLGVTKASAMSGTLMAPA